MVPLKTVSSSHGEARQSLVMKSSKEAVQSAAKEFLHFVNKGVSPYHVVEECRRRLLAAGFIELKESDQWDIKPSSKVSRGSGVLCTRSVRGPLHEVGQGSSAQGQSGVRGLMHEYFVTRNFSSLIAFAKDGQLVQRLFHVPRPLLRIPHLAIHLQRDVNDAFGPNKENHLSVEKHHPALVNVLCSELGVEPETLLDFELCLADTQPAALGGVYQEFIYSPRLDNLHSCYCALQGLMESCSGDSLAKDPNVRMITLYDNEEVSVKGTELMVVTWCLQNNRFGVFPHTKI
ncbi:hypothetical protein FQN60_006529 [Etheostoma spectabile]|uniref:Aspartyl aminopeptidase n=1 Tax=Etheostoma spectabile TaxID=54343 RepID=A0A5J5CFV2_9PERO|nr:hypothetical protein FQN60_006529 [Etheostoma spectabile]